MFISISSDLRKSGAVSQDVWPLPKQTVPRKWHPSNVFQRVKPDESKVSGFKGSHSARKCAISKMISKHFFVPIGGIDLSRPVLCERLN